MKLNFTPVWGIRLIALWAVALALLAFSLLLLLSQAVSVSGDGTVSQAQTWIIFLFNVVFGLGFAISSYGLWTQKNWGRLLFLWTIGLWAGLNLISLLDPGLLYTPGEDYDVGARLLGALRYGVTLVIPFWYLNRTHVKMYFVQNNPQTDKPYTSESDDV